MPAVRAVLELALHSRPGRSVAASKLDQLARCSVCYKRLQAKGQGAMTAYRKVPAGVKWLRVTKQAKCPVPGCNHDGWCFISSDGAESLCMRVQSNREYHFKDGKVGWIHSVNGRVGVPVVRAEKPKPVINTGRLMQEWKAATKPEYLLYLSNTLSIPASVLTDFEFAYCARNGATAIPMRDGYDCYTGIRLRFPNAEYRSIPGSSPGLFIPRCRPETFWDGGQRLILACEGGTSAAAGLSLGWWTVGTANAGQGAG